MANPVTVLTYKHILVIYGMMLAASTELQNELIWRKMGVTCSLQKPLKIECYNGIPTTSEWQKDRWPKQIWNRCH